MNKKITSIIAASTVALGVAGTIIYLEGTNSEVVSQPVIPRVQAPAIVSTETPTKPTNEESKESDSDSKEKKEDSKKESELDKLYQHLDIYREDTTVNSMAYTANSIHDLEKRLLEHINRVNSNTNSKIDAIAGSVSTNANDKVSSLEEKIKDLQNKVNQIEKQPTNTTNPQEQPPPEEPGKSNLVPISNSNIKGTFTGALVNGMPDGNGLFTRYKDDGTASWTFNGTFSKGTLQEGTLTYSDGVVVTSKFYNGAANGSGTVITKDYKYEGSISDGQLTGKGTVKFNTGESYSGEFKDGLYNGLGVYSDTSGEAVLQGIFKNGVFERTEGF
ncbi:hypothetical protein [Clostridium tertium]|uniref:hypothetical protein n=1 Tax=Clostridium tertium TaxID=1559 RepID=UPI0023B2BB73|nr:hypothetical protein [Clostridium tertium]